MIASLIESSVWVQYTATLYTCRIVHLYHCTVYCVYYCTVYCIRYTMYNTRYNTIVHGTILYTVQYCTRYILYHCTRNNICFSILRKIYTPFNYCTTYNICIYIGACFFVSFHCKLNNTSYSIKLPLTTLKYCRLRFMCCQLLCFFWYCNSLNIAIPWNFPACDFPAWTTRPVSAFDMNIILINLELIKWARSINRFNIYFVLFDLTIQYLTISS